MNNILELVQDRAINGKKIVRKMKYYDCYYHHFRNDLDDITTSSCNFNKYSFSDCVYKKNPKDCPSFVCKKEVLKNE